MSDALQHSDSDTGGTSSTMSILALLKGLVTHKASDLHLRAGRPPMYRVNGDIIPTSMAPIKADDLKRLAYSTMTQQQIRDFEMNAQVDFGFVAPGIARFRANVFLQKSSVAMVVRSVPLQIPVLESLGLPSIVGELALGQRGLLLVTGATGSGKSTTLAAMIEHINRKSRSHIVTIEDPIEFVYEDKLCTITQRELGTDASTMQQALKAALRQDPDVIMVGEMRDYETMSIAISAAETGHLVVSTLHTSNAAQSIDRILDSFPSEAKNQVRLQLAGSLFGVITQRLVKRADGKGRVAACEILVRSPSIERLILDNKIAEIEALMESSNVYYKMQTMNQALEKMVREGTITMDEAIDNSDHKEDLRLKLSGMARGSEAEITGAMQMPPVVEGPDAMSQSVYAKPKIPTVKNHGIDAATASGLALEKPDDGGMMRGTIHRKAKKAG